MRMFNQAAQEMSREELHVFIQVYETVIEEYGNFFERAYLRKRRDQEDDIPSFLRAIGYHFHRGDLRANQVLPVVQYVYKKVLSRNFHELNWTDAQWQNAHYWYDKVMQDIEDSLRIR